MDEILRAKKLREEILQRANSIREHMQAVNQSMANMADMETSSEPKPNVPTSSELLDLPTDVLQLVLGTLGSAGDYRCRSNASVLMHVSSCHHTCQ
jgi:hypothetical protein